MSHLSFKLPMTSIIKRYELGESIESIARSFNVDYSTIKSRLDKTDVAFRNSCQRTYDKEYDRHYFNKIDDPFKAYFLGFILGDGVVFKKGNKLHKLSLELHKKDKIIIETFGKLIGIDSKYIKNSTQYPDQKLITLNSKELCESLYEHGVPKKDKSYNAVPIKLDEYQSSFWLGLWDADGGASLTKNSMLFELTGTKEICDGFSKHLGFKGKYVYKRKDTKVYRFKRTTGYSNDVLKIYGKLYDQVPFWLPRKRDKIIDFIEYRIAFEANK